LSFVTSDVGCVAPTRCPDADVADRRRCAVSTVEMLLRLGAGIGLGTVIGFERQYRARMAGLRTNALRVDP
jgi:hypothetical protein